MLQKIRHAVSHRLQRIHHHPFNKELHNGKLPRRKFRVYLEQDALYLSDFSRALNVTSARMSNLKHAQKFKQLSNEMIQTEREMHNKYLGETKWGRFFRQNIYPIHKIPVIMEYSSHIMHHATQKPIDVAVASLLPCFWIYGELGKNMSDVLNQPNHPYYAWIRSYANTEFQASIQEMIEICEDLASQNASPENEENMVNAFLHSTDCEIKFWDSAYHDIEYKENHTQIFMNKVKTS